MNFNISQDSKDFSYLLRNTKRKGIDNLVSFLENETDFFTAPASTKHHSAFAGGLLEHSLTVYEILRNDLDCTASSDSITISALLHDICKVNCYGTEIRNVKENGVWVEKEVYTYQDDLPLGHGEGYMTGCWNGAFRWSSGAIHAGSPPPGRGSRKCGSCWVGVNLNTI